MDGWMARWMDEWMDGWIATIMVKSSWDDGDQI